MTYAIILYIYVFLKTESETIKRFYSSIQIIITKDLVLLPT